MVRYNMTGPAVILVILFTLVVLGLSACLPTPSQTPIIPLTLQKPVNGSTVIGHALSFQWKWSGDLGSEDWFEVKVWQDRKGPGYTAYTKHSTMTLGGPPDGFGSYEWQVNVVHEEGSNYSLWAEGPTWSFVWQEFDLPTETPTPVSIVSIPTYQPLNLQWPINGSTIVGHALSLQWGWSDDLGSEDWFEVMIWRNGRDSGYTTYTKLLTIMLDGPPDGFGSYRWQVNVVREEGSDYSTLVESSVWSLNWEDSSTPVAGMSPTLADMPTPPTDTPEPTDTVTPKPTGALEPTNTPTPEPTATPEPADTPTHTPTDTNTATPTPTTTDTPTVTCTPSITPTPTDTHTPTPTLLPAPVLLEPEEGTAYCPADLIELKWEWKVRSFQANEFYAVRIWKDGTERSRHWEENSNTTCYRKSPKKDRPEWYEGDDAYYLWNIVVLFDTGQYDEHNFKIWKPVSETSENREFYIREKHANECIP